MSFKRDGDDGSLLKNLKYRRVSELLASHIPDDEAMLLSNGRLTCLVCVHRPIFDTLPMLANHRKGKRHISELSRYLTHKRDLELKQMKNDQQIFLRTGIIPTPESVKKPPQHRLVSSTSLYSSCSKRRDKSSLQRKPVLDVDLPTIKPSCIQQSPCVKEPSANSQIRQYLKALSKKTPLEKTVERCRENYNQRGEEQRGEQQTLHMDVCSSEETETHPTVSSSTDSTSYKTSKEVENYMSLKMAGWLKNSEGQWIKDPDVEFDSDEEDPPMLID